MTTVIGHVPPKTPEQWLSYAASLSPIEYEQKRQAIAKSLDFRVSKLDEEVEKRRKPQSDGNSGEGQSVFLPEPEPWSSAVDGAELLSDIKGLFEKYIVLPSGAAVTLALWVMHTYLLDAADVSPIAAICSPEKRCGKTIVLEVLQSLVYRPLPASNITAAALFRTVERFKPTLLIDEADTFLSENDELRGVLNSGHRRGQAFVLRCTGDDNEPRQFSTWSPKAIALIGKLPPTLEDRSIVISMKRRARNETVERVRHDTLLKETTDLRRKIARWRDDHSTDVRKSDPPLPDRLNDRARDCWRSLVAIADAIGGQWPQLARDAAQILAVESDSIGEQLLSDIRNLFQRRKAEVLSTKAIVMELINLEGRKWPEWKNGKPMSKSQLSRQLSKFDIVSGTIRLENGTTAKGYKLSQFDDAFARYCPQNDTTSQPASDLNCDEIKTDTSENDVTFSRPSQPAPVEICDDVTFPVRELRPHEQRMLDGFKNRFGGTVEWRRNQQQE